VERPSVSDNAHQIFHGAGHARAGVVLEHGHIDEDIGFEDAAPVATYITGKGRVPLIDPNKRRGAERIVFTPAQKERFKIRTTVERANAHLKDWLIPAQIFVRGVKKVSFQLLCGVLCLAALKILQYFILPPAQQGA